MSGDQHIVLRTTVCSCRRAQGGRRRRCVPRSPPTVYGRATTLNHPCEGVGSIWKENSKRRASIWRAAADDRHSAESQKKRTERAIRSAVHSTFSFDWFHESGPGAFNLPLKFRVVCVYFLPTYCNTGSATNPYTFQVVGWIHNHNKIQ